MWKSVCNKVRLFFFFLVVFALGCGSVGPENTLLIDSGELTLFGVNGSVVEKVFWPITPTSDKGARLKAEFLDLMYKFQKWSFETEKGQKGIEKAQLPDTLFQLRLTRTFNSELGKDYPAKVLYVRLSREGVAAYGQWTYRLSGTEIDLLTACLHPINQQKVSRWRNGY